MLQSLKFSATFERSGKTIRGDHTFEKGFTAITGRNGKGKSLRLEMIRFGLFGTKALRAPLASYKELSCTVTIKMNGRLYSIHRQLSMATMTVDGSVKCKGTKPVNDAVAKLFGYDLEVFDVANACLQGQIEAMTQKTPAERKMMVDRVLGMDAIDQLITESGKKVGELNRKVEALSSTIHALTTPSIPEGYQCSTLLQDLIDDLHRKKEEEVGLLAELNALKCPMPNMSSGEGIEDIAFLNSYKMEYSEIAGKIRSLETESNRLTPLFCDSAYDDYKLYLAAKGDEQWENFHLYESEVRKENHRYQDLLSHRDSLEEKKTQCPKCQHEWTGFEKEIKELTTKINTQSIYIGSILPVPQPSFNNYGSKELVELKVQKIETARVAEVRRQEIANDLVSLYMKLDDQKFKDLEKRIHLSASHAKEFDQYQHKTAMWDKYQAVKARIEPLLPPAGELDHRLNQIKGQLEKSFTYENRLVEFNVKSRMFAVTQAQIDELQAQASQHTAARKALSELKPKVKSYLLPSLSKVASDLLSEMTNGELTEIMIDDEFNIKADGDPIECLSGSAKAVANLAVRIGLGTVLTNKIFSVLLFDEIDASMDVERAEYTAQCIRRLTKTFGQIILVSHKQPEADHQVEII